MRYHDFYLQGYTVTKFGGEIILTLVWDYPDTPVEQSSIRFSDVAAYHFIHTGRAIITEIMDVPLPRLFSEYGEQIANWWQMQGGLMDEQAEYVEVLKQKGYSGWLIYSAIGFQGFVIARSVSEDVCNS